MQFKSCGHFTNSQYTLIQSVADFERCAKRIAKSGTFAFDTENTGLNIYDLSMVGFSMAWREKGQTFKFYCPVGHSTEGNFKNVPLNKLRPTLNKLFGMKNLKCVAHNLKYDYNVMRKHGVQVKNAYLDTMTLSWLYDENGSHGLKNLAIAQLGVDSTNLQTYKDFGVKDGQGNLVPIHKIAKYACDDADFTLRLYEYYREGFLEHPDNKWLRKYLFEVETPLSLIVADMEWHGIPIDDAVRQAKLKDCVKKARTYQQMIFREAGKEFNINSPIQLKKILFEDLELTPIKFNPVTPKQKQKNPDAEPSPSTDKEVLTELYASGVKIAEYILKFRKYHKFGSTFLTNMEPKADGCLHASFNQNGTVTGRFSSSSPNMQNIPAHNDDIGIRQCIVPFPKEELIVVDYSQIELRVMAYASRDPVMLEAYQKGKDLHARSARTFGLNPSEKEERQIGKTANFAWVYGGGAGILISLLAEQAGIKIDYETAKDYHFKFKKLFRGLFAYLNRVQDIIVEQGVVQSVVTHRRRRIPEAMKDLKKLSEEQRKKVFGYIRQANNFIGQGGAADIIKIGMVKLAPHLKKYGARMLMQVHDELVISCPKKHVVACQRAVKNVLEGCVPHFSKTMPLVTDIGTGKSWSEAKH